MRGRVAGGPSSGCPPAPTSAGPAAYLLQRLSLSLSTMTRRETVERDSERAGLS